MKVAAKVSLVFLVLALALTTDKAYSFNMAETSHGLNHFQRSLLSGGGGSGGAVGDYIGDNNEMLFDTEASRRTLAQGRSHISYQALKANSVPCGRRGQSYYDCQKRKRANPYRRGCSAITHCARVTG
ncbi:protein RALF-like 19 [Humulus lupulus]|uniref:protein RALF-like 19 n=1 Tax=Humulus lupulus TaxID=3486 RepID=UPI002B4118B3|nr:protein RALF-like 19 [Humulus lupulus]